MRVFLALSQFLIQHFAGLVLLLVFMTTGEFSYLYAINAISVLHVILFAFGALFTWTQSEDDIKRIVGPIDQSPKFFRGWRLIVFTTFHVGSIMFFIKNDFFKSAILMAVAYGFFWLMVGKILSITSEEEADE